MTRLDDQAHVATQYRDASRLDARQRIYQVCDPNPQTWPHWLFDELRLGAGERVLDLGCGTGTIWRENSARLPAGLALELVDASPGMLDEARARLAGFSPKPTFRVGDARALPLGDASCDVVLASHMLYHVPERPRVYAEVRRVLRPGGRFVVTTNLWTHLLELRELVLRFGMPGMMLAPLRSADEYDLERAADEIAAAGFSGLRVATRRSALVVREPGVLIDYVRSLGDANPGALADLRAHVERQIALAGALHVGTGAGAVEARRP